MLFSMIFLLILYQELFSFFHHNLLCTNDIQTQTLVSTNTLLWEIASKEIKNYHPAWSVPWSGAFPGDVSPSIMAADHFHNRIRKGVGVDHD